MTSSKSSHNSPGYVITGREIFILCLLAVHLALSRDQIMALAGFGSVGRTNARLLVLMKAGLIRRVRLGVVSLETGFTAQSVYTATPAAAIHIVQATGQDIKEVRARLASAQGASGPAFRLHALLSAELRVCFSSASNKAALRLDWVGEPQCCHMFEVRSAPNAGKGSWERHLFRPDALLFLSDAYTRGARFATKAFALESDRGHTPRRQWAERFRTVRAFTESGLFARAYPHTPNVTMLVVTEAGMGRVENLLALARECGYTALLCTTAALVRECGPFAPVWFAPSHTNAPQTLLKGINLLP